MSRRSISLKARVRYEGRSHTLDRRSTIADLDKLPDPIWRTVGLILRSKFNDGTQVGPDRK